MNVVFVPSCSCEQDVAMMELEGWVMPYLERGKTKPVPIAFLTGAIFAGEGVRTVRLEEVMQGRKL